MQMPRKGESPETVDVLTVEYGVPTLIMLMETKKADRLKPRVAKYTHDTLYRPYGTLTMPEADPILQVIYHLKTRKFFFQRTSYTSEIEQRHIVCDSKVLIRTWNFLGRRQFVDMGDIVKRFGNMSYDQALEFIKALPAEHLKYIQQGVQNFICSKYCFFLPSMVFSNTSAETHSWRKGWMYMWPATQVCTMVLGVERLMRFIDTDAARDMFHKIRAIAEFNDEVLPPYVPGAPVPLGAVVPLTVVSTTTFKDMVMDKTELPFDKVGFFSYLITENLLINTLCRTSRL